MAHGMSAASITKRAMDAEKIQVCAENGAACAEFEDGEGDGEHGSGEEVHPKRRECGGQEAGENGEGDGGPDAEDFEDVEECEEEEGAAHLGVGVDTWDGDEQEHNCHERCQDVFARGSRPHEAPEEARADEGASPVSRMFPWRAKSRSPWSGERVSERPRSCA